MKHTHGSIEVVCGSMFSGKTDELIRRLVRATIAKQKVQVFKPAIDVRYAVEKVTSHAGSNYDATPVEKSIAILSKIEKDTTVVAIDEAQFFDAEVVRVVQQLASRGIRVLVKEKDLKNMHVWQVMEPPPPLVDVSTPAKALIPLVRFAKCILVSEKGTVIGIVTITDTLKMVE